MIHILPSVDIFSLQLVGRLLLASPLHYSNFKSCHHGERSRRGKIKETTGRNHAAIYATMLKTVVNALMDIPHQIPVCNFTRKKYGVKLLDSHYWIGNYTIRFLNVGDLFLSLLNQSQVQAAS